VKFLGKSILPINFSFFSFHFQTCWSSSSSSSLLLLSRLSPPDVVFQLRLMSFVCLSVSLPVCLSVFMSVCFLSVCFYISLLVFYLFVFISAYLFLRLSVLISACMFLSLSACLLLYLSVCFCVMDLCGSLKNNICLLARLFIFMSTSCNMF